MPVTRGGRGLLEARKAVLNAMPDVRFAGGAMVDPATREPVLYTENSFVKFADSADTEACRAVLRDLGLAIKAEPGYAANAFFAGAPEGRAARCSISPRAAARAAMSSTATPNSCEAPAAGVIYPLQWHLKATTVGGVAIDQCASVEAAHAATRGAGVTIAVIDDGIDIDHAEFGGAGKMSRHAKCSPATTTRGRAPAVTTTAPRAPASPAPTRCCRRQRRGAGCEADADGWLAWARTPRPKYLGYAADRGADVISCSWARPTANGGTRTTCNTRPPNAAGAHAAGHRVRSHARARRQGLRRVLRRRQRQRERGIPMVMRATRCAGHRRVQLHRGKRSVYSDFGNAVWCSFPSSDFEFPEENHPAPLTPGIWTTDRTGKQATTGRAADGDVAGLFTNSFGGTSSACPGAAGVAALVLSVNSATREEVKDIFKRASERIDPQGGQYNAAGRSKFYGWGRLNAKTAVELARPQPRNEVTVSRRFDAPIPDLQTVSFTLDVPDTQVVSSVSVAVDLAHSYIGNLVLTLEPPAATGVSAIVLHNRTGGTRNGIKKVYDKSNTARLANFAGKACNGRWTLKVKDAAAKNSGTLASFSVRLVFAAPGAAVPVKVPAKKAGAKKVAAKKVAAKKVAAKKVAAKTVVAKKAAGKKTATKKTATGKTVTKNAGVKKAEVRKPAAATNHVATPAAKKATATKRASVHA
ncbi:MAG: proprotein convertase P-domain-containing protein [Rubrivivax sp.]